MNTPTKIAGCDVIVWRVGGPETVLRCPCGQTFPVEKTVAVAKGADLRCPECRPPVPPPLAVRDVQNAAPGNGYLKLAPKAGTKSAAAVDLMLAGMHYREAAQTVKICEQAGEKLYFRYVLYAELLRLRQRVAELEGKP